MGRCNPRVLPRGERHTILPYGHLQTDSDDFEEFVLVSNSMRYTVARP